LARVVLESVSKAYPGDVRALHELTLVVDDGEFLTLVGPSGCGKSTTLNIIAGLETPTTGSVRIGGEEVTRRPPRERDVAMVFQDYALYPHMNVRQNIGFPLKFARLKRKQMEARIGETAELLGLAELLGRRPKELSGGQRQRVALARALVRRPKVFLFDEPLSNLDPALRVELRSELKRLHAELEATFVYVTHDQSEAMTLSDRVVVLHEGVLQQVGPPGDIYARPANSFVARFFGLPRINLVDAHVLGLDGVFDPETCRTHVFGVRPRMSVSGLMPNPMRPCLALSISSSRRALRTG
jgi:multiple sugar transport system ATP-binding protein